MNFDLIKSKTFRRYFILYSSIFVSCSIISTIIGLKYAYLSDNAIFFVRTYTSLKYGDIGIVSILANNFIVSILMMYSFYSLELDRFKKFLGMFYFLYMGTITGLVISKVIIIYNLVIALSMIVPHGIIEIPAMISAISAGWTLSELKTKDEKYRISEIYMSFICMSLIIFFMLGIAAYIESYVTPNIFKILVSYYQIAK